jgi:hypothetical protein
VDFGTVKDAHNLLGQSEYLNLWIPEVDAYLGERGLPNKEVYPEFLPDAATVSDQLRFDR